MLYPTVMRQMLLGCASQGGFEPLWSPRILAEWEHAAAKHGDAARAEVQSEAVLLNMRYPKASVSHTPEQEARFWLPDPSDVHVLASAVIGSADGIITLNNKDFPATILAEEGLSRVNPDAFLLGLWHAQPELVSHAADHVLAQARQWSGKAWSMTALMKKARLHRLGRALGGAI